jgi:hypothetical protein
MTSATITHLKREPPPRLSRTNRRLLLSASLRLLLHRVHFGKPVLRADVERVASIADDADGSQTEGACG